MTPKNLTWGVALFLLLAGSYLFRATNVALFLMLGAGWLIGARQAWLWGEAKAFLGAVGELTKGLRAQFAASKKPVPVTQHRGFVGQPVTSGNAFALPWLRIAIVVLAIAFVAWIVIGVFGFFRDVGCAVRAITPWPCETRESLRAERDDLRGRLAIENSRSTVNAGALDLADESQTREAERQRILAETLPRLARPAHPPALEEIMQRPLPRPLILSLCMLMLSGASACATFQNPFQQHSGSPYSCPVREGLRQDQALSPAPQLTQGVIPAAERALANPNAVSKADVLAILGAMLPDYLETLALSATQDAELGRERDRSHELLTLSDQCNANMPRS